jgi:hypothetical protein
MGPLTSPASVVQGPVALAAVARHRGAVARHRGAVARHRGVVARHRGVVALMQLAELALVPEDSLIPEERAGCCPTASPPT